MEERRILRLRWGIGSLLTLTTVIAAALALWIVELRLYAMLLLAGSAGIMGVLCLKLNHGLGVPLLIFAAFMIVILCVDISGVEQWEASADVFVDVTVTDSSGEPLENVEITLATKDRTVFDKGETNKSGQAVLEYQAQTGGRKSNLGILYSDRSTRMRAPKLVIILSTSNNRQAEFAVSGLEGFLEPSQSVSMEVKLNSDF